MFYYYGNCLFVLHTRLSVCVCTRHTLPSALTYPYLNNSQCAVGKWNERKCRSREETEPGLNDKDRQREGTTTTTTEMNVKYLSFAFGVCHIDPQHA